MPAENTSTNETTENNPSEQQQTKETKPEEKPPEQQTKTPETNYQELLKTDKAFQSFLDKIVTKANETAVTNALQKQQRANDEKLSRAERLQAMSDGEKIKFLEEENKKLNDKYLKDKEIESLKTKTAMMLSENKIPSLFMDIFDFDNVTAEDISKRITALSGYEYHEKGTFDKALKAQVDIEMNNKFKQKTPESHNTNPDDNDLFMQGFNGGYSKTKK